MAPKPAPEPAREPSFEDRLAELNTLLTALEGGELGLEESIAAYEKGRRLHRELLGRLDAFERRIEVLTKGADGADRAIDAPELDPDRAEAAPSPSAASEKPAAKAADAAPAPKSAKKKPAYDDDVPF
jgi:exodeoxyribonuclease VII small subunit